MMAAAMPDGARADDLLSSPDLGLLAKLEQGQPHEQANRATCTHTNNSDRFVTGSSLKEKAFRTQFASIYYQRLMQMTPALRKAATAKWISSGQHAGKPTPTMVNKILEVKSNERCIIVGTVYKEMKLKPNILDEYHAREKYEAPPPVRSKYHQPDDTIIMEDQSGRIAITGSIVPGDLVSGVLMAALGVENDEGDFEVEDVCFCDGGPQQALSTEGSDVFVALVSGLEVGEGNQDSLLPMQMFIDYVTGQLGSPAEQECASKIARVIVAGNLIERIDSDVDDVAVYKRKGVDAKTVNSMKELDQVLTHLTACVPVDIMAGPYDPSNQTMPQQPLHRCMFPLSASTGILRGATNPYDCTINGLTFLGTSGQNVDDVYRFSSHEKRLSILECIHKWRHLCPTAPDTLGCFPFYQNDPFVVLDHTPHVMFAGNQPEFGSTLVKGVDGQVTRLICVPSFRKTCTIVMLNTRTLDCYPVSFSGFDEVGEDVADMEQ